MALSSITQEQLLNKRNDENSWDIVVLYNRDCTVCEDWEALIETMSSNYASINFSRLEVTAEDIPIFAPPLVPSIIALHNGTRLWELIGVYDTTELLEHIIDEWLEGRINFGTVSGSTPIQEYS